MTFSKGQISIAVLPMKETPRESWMQHDLVQCIDRHMPLDVEEELCVISVKYPQIFDILKKDITDLCRLGQL